MSRLGYCQPEMLNLTPNRRRTRAGSWLCNRTGCGGHPKKKYPRVLDFWAPGKSFLRFLICIMFVCLFLWWAGVGPITEYSCDKPVPVFLSAMAKKQTPPIGRPWCYHTGASLNGKPDWKPPISMHVLYWPFHKVKGRKNLFPIPCFRASPFYWYKSLCLGWYVALIDIEVLRFRVLGRGICEMREDWPSLVVTYARSAVC